MAFFNDLVEGLFFQADRFAYWTPAHMGVKFVQLSLKTEDNKKLDGVWMPAVNTLRGTVVFCHSGMQNYSNHITQVCWLPSQGYNVLMFDYRGFGKSEGEVSLSNIMTDLSYVLEDYIFKKDPLELGQKLVLYGQFVGADAILRCLLKRTSIRTRITNLIIESTYINHRSFLLSKYGPGLGHLLNLFLPKDLEDPGAELKHLTIPVIIITPTRDEMVPESQSNAIISIAPPQRKIIYAMGKKFLEPMRLPGIWREQLLELLNNEPA